MSEKKAFDYFCLYLQFYEESWTIYSDVLGALEFLRRHGIEMGVLSDGAQDQQELKLSKTGISHYFKFLITADSKGMSKPDPHFFQRGAALFHTEPGKVIYVGDNLMKDAVGSEKAGLLGVWLNRTGSSGSFKRCISSLREIETSGFFGTPHGSDV